MNSITTDIAELLYEYECVVVPGFGGFVTNYRSAEINEQHIVPPSRDLDFVDLLTFNDGVLVNRLTQKNGGSYQEALADIETFTYESLATLNHREAISVPKVGEISLDAGQNVQFQPENTNFLADAFGLPELHLMPLEKTTILQPIEAPESAPIIKSETKNMAKSTFSLFNIIVLTGILVGGYMLWNRYQENKLNPNTRRTEKKIPVIDDEEYYDESEDVGVIDTDDRHINPSIKETTDTYVDDMNETSEPTIIVDAPVRIVPRETVVQKTPVVTAPRKTTPPPTRSTKRRYVVVVGSFGNSTYADNMIRRCKKAGYEVESKWSGNMKRVGVVLYCAPNQLNSQLAKVQRQFNPQAWIVK